MLDTKKEVVAALSGATALNVYYELFCDGKTQTPCITYIQSGDSTLANGDTLGYSDITYIVKIWGTKLADLEDYAEAVDNAMRQKGFTRVARNELSAYNQIQIVLTYNCLGLEKFN